MKLDKLTRQAAAGSTFEVVASEVHATKHSGWSRRCASRCIERMVKGLYFSPSRTAFGLMVDGVSVQKWPLFQRHRGRLGVARR